MVNDALGLIEVIGYIPAVEAADAALKAANVKLIFVEKVGGGIVTIGIMGDVGAVTASVDAGAIAAENIGILRTKHVIPRAHPDVQTILTSPKPKQAAKPGSKAKKVVKTKPEPKPMKKTETKLEIKPEDKPKTIKQIAEPKQFIEPKQVIELGRRIDNTIDYTENSLAAIVIDDEDNNTLNQTSVMTGAEWEEGNQWS